MPAASSRRYATRQRSKTTVEATLHRTCSIPVEKLLRPNVKVVGCLFLQRSRHTVATKQRARVWWNCHWAKKKAITATGQKITINATVQKHTHNHCLSTSSSPSVALAGVHEYALLVLGTACALHP